MGVSAAGHAPSHGPAGHTGGSAHAGGSTPHPAPHVAGDSIGAHGARRGGRLYGGNEQNNVSRNDPDVRFNESALKNLLITGGLIGIVGVVSVFAVTLLIDYEIQKHAVKNGIKAAANDGVWAPRPQRPPVIVMSQPAAQQAA